VALKNLYLAFISPNMANYYFFFFSCCINSRGVFKKGTLSTLKPEPITIGNTQLAVI